MSTNLTTPTPAIPPPAPTREEKLERARTLISNAARRASDEAVNHLSCQERDQIASLLTETLRLLREAREATAPDEGEAEAVIICREFGGEEFAAAAIRGECQTYAYYYALASSSH